MCIVTTARAGLTGVRVAEERETEVGNGAGLYTKTHLRSDTASDVASQPNGTLDLA